ARANGMLCSTHQARRPQFSVFHDAERFSDRENPLTDYHPAFHHHDHDSEAGDDPASAENEQVLAASAVTDSIALFTALGWPEPTVKASIDYICERLARAGNRATAFEALRRDKHARALLDLPSPSWHGLLRTVLGNPEPVYVGTSHGRGVVVVSERNGFIELERTVESITIGTRHRTDYGDLAQLIASIKRDGLLQPVTITPDGVLVCGARRLAAIKQLGWRTVNVWVRSGITDRLGALLAEQDENLLHKPLTPTEQATLYRELKEIMAEEAAQRQAATQFGTDGKQTGEPGAGESPGPHGMKGDAREQAARLITGTDASQRLERIAHLQTLAENPDQSEEVRQRARAELAAIDTG